MTTKTTTCRICRRTMPDDPGAYYHRKACEASSYRAALAMERCKDAPDPAELRRLEAALESAEYVGD